VTSSEMRDLFIEGTIQDIFINSSVLH